MATRQSYRVIVLHSSLHDCSRKFPWRNGSARNQNQNSLLMTYVKFKTIPHQRDGFERRGLVPSSLKRSKFRHTIICHFSRGDQRIRGVIPTAKSLGKNCKYAFVLAEGI